MNRKLLGRIAALCSAGLLAAAGVALWLGADSPRAEATRMPVAETAAPVLSEAEDPDPVVEPARPKSREEKRFARADRDDDGRISMAEYLQQRRRNFDKLDVNGDGKLGFEEYAVSGVEKFRKADSNRDNVLLAAEFATTATPQRKSPATAAKCACTPVATAATEGE